MILLQNKAPYRRVFLTLNQGYLLNNIFPFRLGELGRAFLLSQATNNMFKTAITFFEKAKHIIIHIGFLDTWL